MSLPRFFAITSLLVLLIAAGLFSTGVGRLEAMGVLPASDPVWDSSWLLRDDGSIGGFLSGLAGYRARPSALELGGYVLYVVGAGMLFFAPGRPRRPAPPPAPRPTPAEAVPVR